MFYLGRFDFQCRNDIVNFTWNKRIIGGLIRIKRVVDMARVIHFWVEMMGGSLNIQFHKVVHLF